MDPNKKFVGVSIDDRHVRLELEGKCKEQAKQLEDKQKEIDRIEGFLFGYKTLQRPFKYVIDLEERCKRHAEQLKEKQQEIDKVRKELEVRQREIDRLQEVGCDDTKEYLCSANCDPCPFDSDKAARDGFPNCYVENLREANKKQARKLETKECEIQDLCRMARREDVELRTLKRERDELREESRDHYHIIKNRNEKVVDLRGRLKVQIEVREKVEEQLKEMKERVLDAELARDRALGVAQRMVEIHQKEHPEAHAAFIEKEYEENDEPSNLHWLGYVEENDEMVQDGSLMFKHLKKFHPEFAKTMIEEEDKVGDLGTAIKDSAQHDLDPKDEPLLTEEEETGVKIRHAEDCC